MDNNISTKSLNNSSSCVVCFEHTQNRTVCAHLVCVNCLCNIRECPICRFDLTLTDEQIIKLIEEKEKQGKYIVINIEPDERIENLSAPLGENTPLTTSLPLQRLSSRQKCSKCTKILITIFSGVFAIAGVIVYVECF